MTGADEFRAYIDQILSEMQIAVGNGSAAMTELNEGIGFLRLAKEKMEGSRVHALQELEHLITLAAMTERLLADSNSIDVMDAQYQVKQAAKDVEFYANRMSFAVNNLEKLISVIEKNRRDQELNPSGDALRSAFNSLHRYRNNP